MTTAFLGLGRMGLPMARHLRDADLVVWDRTPGRGAELPGAREAGSVREAVEGAQVVVLVLSGPQAVREVLPEVVAAAPPGALLVNCTTTAPADAHAFAKAAEGLRYVEAPLTGSVEQAGEGVLGVLGGAGEDDWAAALPVLHAFGDPAQVRRVGAVGAGSATALCSVLALGPALAGIGEALRLGRDLGLDRAELIEVLAAGPLGVVVADKRPLLDSEDYAEPAYGLDLLAEALQLAVDAAESDLPVTSAVLSAARSALDAGHTGEDVTALTGHLADEGRADSW